MTSITVSTLAILVAIALFIILSMRGIGPLISAVIAAALVSLTSVNGFATSFFTDFLGGVTSMVGNMFFLLVIGSIFGGVLSATGASERIGKTFVKVMGPTNFMFALILTNMLLAATGAVPYVLMAFLSFGVLKEANLPRYIAMTAVCGTMVISQSVLPGTTTLGNLIPSAMLGVNLYSAPLLGISTGIVGVILNIIFILYLIKDARKKGIGYEPMPNESQYENRKEEELPGFWAAFAPVIFLLAFCFITIIGFKLNATQAVVYATVLATALLYLFCRKNYRGPGLWKTIESNATFIIPNLLAASCVFGFASVVRNTSAFTALVGVIGKSNMNPYVLVFIGVILLTAMTASGLSGLNSFVGVLGNSMVAQGVSAEVIHRLGNIVSSTWDSLPHNSYICLILPVFGYTHKQGYKYLFISNVVIPMIYSVFALGVALIFY